MQLKRVMVVGLVVLLMGSSCALAGPAQQVLEDLAETERNARVVSAYTTIGIGVAIGVGSYLVLAGSGAEIYGLLGGGLIAATGVIPLFVPSEAERACADACGSEAESALALERLAAQGRLDRYISGATNVAAGVISLLYPINIFTRYDNLLSAVSSFGMAAVDFLFPSKEEAAYARYEALAASGG